MKNLEKINLWFIENDIQLHVVVKFLIAARGYLKKFEIRFMNPIPQQPMDVFFDAISKSKVLELVEVDGPNM
jgi:hypothetical protein